MEPAVSAGIPARMAGSRVQDIGGHIRDVLYKPPTLNRTLRRHTYSFTLSRLAFSYRGVNFWNYSADLNDPALQGKLSTVFNGF